MRVLHTVLFHIFAVSFDIMASFVEGFWKEFRVHVDLQKILTQLAL